MADYYFDLSNGSDAAAGTQVAPKQNPSTVTFSAGDRCFLRRGTRNIAPAGTLAISIPANNIQVLDYDTADEPPTIDCANVARGISIGTNIAGWTIGQSSGYSFTLRLTNVAGGTSRRGIVNSTTGSSESTAINGIVQRVKIDNVLTDSANDCDGIQLFGAGIQILDCLIEDIATDGIWVRCQGITIGRCIVRRVAQDDSVRTPGGDCIQFGGAGASDFSGSIVYQCLLDHRSAKNTKNTIIVSSASATTNLLLLNNEFYGATVAGQVNVYIDVPGALLRGNRIYGGDYGIYMVSASGGTVKGNVVKDSNFGIRNASSAASVAIDNNTILSCGTGVYSADNQTNFVRNNIITGCGAGVTRHASAVTENYNCFFGNTTNSNQALGANSVTTDPQLNSSLLPLAAGVRSAGTTLVGQDFYGNFFSCPPTIGAIQYNPERNTVDRTTVDRTTIDRSVTYRRGIAA